MSLRSSTIRDVARHAGVSVTTVSYVFNEKPGISMETRERVRRSAAELHYSPNALIRSLQLRRTQLLGVYLWRMDDDPTRTLVSDLMRGITEELAATEYDLLVYGHRPGRFEHANITAFLDKRVDGLIWTPAPMAFGALEPLNSAGLPTVAVLYGQVPPGIGHVGVENASGARGLVEHLLGLGHRRIGFSGSGGLSDFDERLEGYRDALRAAGLEPAFELAPLNAWSHPDEVLRRTAETGATTLLCVTDYHALEVREAALANGLSVPGDLSIAGFNDVPAARLIGGGLTTVSIPAEKIGRIAVRLLLDLVQGGEAAAARRTLPVELQIRGSTAAPH